jgi:glycosyltransferase involved in cell wall biosynthesis
MKICIDARPVSEHMHGISRYAFNLIKQLASIDQHHEYFILARSDHRLFSELPSNFTVQGCAVPNYSLTEQFVIPRLLKKESVDLFHSSTYSAPVLQFCKTVVTIHDLIPLVFPHHYGWRHAIYYKHIVRRALHKAQRIITVSHSSKRDLMKYFNLNPSEIVVVHNGVDERFKPDSSGLSKKTVSELISTEDPFILSVVNNKPHKNISALIEAFNKASAHMQTFCKLVIVGIKKKDGLKNIPEERMGRLICLPKVTDEQLIALYQNAALLVLPSLYEGFCLPVLEAMACGAPVITSHVSSLPEVAGDATILVDPNNIDELAEAIYNVLAFEDLQEGLKTKGIRQAKRFSWQETARKTLKIYKEVMSLE